MHVTLIEAPLAKPLKILDIAGGETVHRRLMALGFHKGACVELLSMAIMKGPILVRHLSSDTQTALGRGVAGKIMVEVLDDGRS